MWRYQPSLECLEARTVPSAFLSLTGGQTLVPGANVDASSNRLTGESEMQVSINPANAMQVAGFTRNANNSNELSVYWSNNGGTNWSRTIISGGNDGLGVGNRFKPTLKFDANGHLFIAYGFDDGHRTRLVTARSDDGGASFFQFRLPQVGDDPGFNADPNLSTFLTTGLDATTGGQAVYIAYAWMNQDIRVVGSNDGGFSYTQPRQISDDDDHFSTFAGPAVGPNGELYVVWHDAETGQIKLDRDLDGLWGQYYQFGGDVVVRNLRENFIGKTTPADPRGGFDNGPSIDVSRTFPFYGRIYVTLTDTFSRDDTDIYLLTSDDHGSTWQLNGSFIGEGNVEASTGTDFLATIAVDQSSGSVNVGYYTSDGDQLTGNDDVNFRVASSVDGGGTWARANLSSATSHAAAIRNPFELGDYVGLAVFDGTIRGFWTDNRGSTRDSEAFTAAASLHSATGSNALFITGTDASDLIVVTPNITDNNYVTVSVNGQNQYTGLWATLDGISVSGYGGDDSIFVGTRDARAPAGVPVSVFGGTGNDSIHIILNQGLTASSVRVFGEDGSDSVTLWDNLDPANARYTITDSTVTVTGEPVPFGGLTYDGIESLTLRAGPGNNTISIPSTAPNTPVAVDAGDGNDTLIGPVVNSTWIVNASNHGTVGNITFNAVENLTGSDGADVFVFDNSAGAVSGRVNGGGGANILEYSRYPSGISVHLANSPTPGTATATGGVLNIQTVYGSRYNDVLIGNDQDNTFLTYGGRDVVRAGGGNDTIHVVGVQDPASTIDGGTGSNLLWPDNVGANTWTLTGAGAGTVSSTGFANGNALAFTNMQRLLGGRYADTFRVRSGASFTYLSGYGGTNWLDYSAYPSAVSVNLAGHRATGVAGANLFLIQNVFGSTTATNTLVGFSSNILIGGNAADTIIGGIGRSILIGGRGTDAVAGGTADDIVIGGFTDYDRNQAALETIMQEWSSTSDSYLVRISKIRAGFGWHTRYRLVWGSGAATTVHDDAAADTLRGDPAGSSRRGSDWFFANQGPGIRDAILDLQRGEKVDNQS
jgi:hypothetical protein